MLRIEKFKGKGRQPYYFRLKAANGRTIAASEGYSTAYNRDRGVGRLVEQTGGPMWTEWSVKENVKMDGKE